MQGKDLMVKFDRSAVRLLQELPKLLRGYHKCTVDEAVKLAAYIFRIKYKDDKSKLQNIPYVFDIVQALK